MKLAVVILLGMLEMVAASSAAQTERKDPFTITISAPANVNVGEEVRVRIIFTNVSDKPYFYTVSAKPSEAEYEYIIKAWSADGKEAPETDYGRRIRLGEFILPGRAGGAVDPGEKVEEDSTISKLFDLSTPGKYEIEVDRPVYDDPKWIVKSHRISITVD